VVACRDGGGSDDVAARGRRRGALAHDVGERSGAGASTGATSDHNGTVGDGTTVSAVTTKETFRMAALNSFDPYVFPFVGAIAALAQVENQEKSLGRRPGAYAVRYATSLADSSISSFLTSAIVPTLLKQDPRYFELRQGGVWHRARYAASRTLITRSRSGETQFNLSGIGGNAVAAAVSNLYYPSGDHSTAQTLTRWGTQVMWDAVSNELKEFWPDIRRKMHHH
jgi:hypothetical protein